MLVSRGKPTSKAQKKAADEARVVQAQEKFSMQVAQELWSALMREEQEQKDQESEEEYQRNAGRAYSPLPATLSGRGYSPLTPTSSDDESWSLSPIGSMSPSYNCYSPTNRDVSPPPLEESQEYVFQF